MTAIVAERPTMRPIFAILLPTMLPIMIAGSFFMLAMTEDAISGIDVPTATSVSPMTNSEIPSAFAIREARSTNTSDPLTRRTRPMRRRRMLMNIKTPWAIAFKSFCSLGSLPYTNQINNTFKIPALFSFLCSQKKQRMN